MEFEEVRTLPAGELSDALDGIGIVPGWALGDQIRVASGERPADPCLPDPPERRIQAFQNLVVGTMAERAFRDRHLANLEAAGFEVFDYHEAGENRDYGLQQDGVELPINVKVASTMFRKARQVVGLDPEDCVPISAYKAIGASERVPDLVYVDLVDFALRERVDSFMDGIDGDLAVGWHLLSWYGGTGARRAQDQYLTTLFERRGAELVGLIAADRHFHVISALRVLAVMRENPRRVPGLGVKGAGTGTWISEVNVHISVQDEMRPWEDVAEECRGRDISAVLVHIRNRATIDVPDPRL